MSAWESVKELRDRLWADVLKELSEAERKILIDLIQLEVDNRALAEPRIKKPLKEKVEGYIP